MGAQPGDGFGSLRGHVVTLSNRKVARMTVLALHLFRREGFGRNGTAWPPELQRWVEELRDLAGIGGEVRAEVSEVPSRCRLAVSECSGSLGTREVAELLGASESWVTRLVRCGQLGGHRGRRNSWHIDREDVMRVRECAA